MARNVTLEKLLTDFRAEARLSLLPAHNVQTRDTQVILLQREQDRLWGDFAWPHLRVDRFIPVQAGQRFYDTDAAVTESGATPVSQIPVDRIESIHIKSDGRWLPLKAGITAEHYAAHDSALDQRAWPPRAWKISEQEQIEVWPVPDTNAGDEQHGLLRITGIRALRPLVQQDDRADLDDRLIVLFAAGAYLASTGAKDAQVKLEAANRHFGRLKGALSQGADFNMFGTTRGAEPPRRPVISNYKPPVA